MPANKSCSLVFLLTDTKILLAMKKRGFGSDLYNGIGGKQDPGESMEETMIRETREEIGVTPVEYEKVAIHDFVMDSDGDSWHMHVDAYICRAWEGDPVETEEMAPKWFALDSIPYDQMWEDDKIWLPLVLEGKKLRATFGFSTADAMESYDLQIVESLA